MYLLFSYFIFFFFNDTATTEIYTLSLHDALPIFASSWVLTPIHVPVRRRPDRTLVSSFGQRYLVETGLIRDRKSTRLNSSHANISYAVFCLKKKKKCTY